MKIFDEHAIDWATAARHGISKKMLERDGYLDVLLAGGATPDIPLRLDFNDMVVFVDASISLKRDEIGIVTFEILGVGWH